MIKRCKNIFVFLVVSCFAFAITGTVAADTINLAEGTDYTLNYSDASPKNEGTYTVSVTGKGNYTGTTDTANFSIGKKTLDVSKFDYGTITKVYDGTTNAPSGFVITVTPASGLESGDEVTVTGTATYNSKDVAIASQISVTGMTLGGTAAENYSLSSDSYTVTGATITAKQLTVSDFTYSPTTKVYDGNTDAPSDFAITPTTASGLVSGNDDVKVTGTATYNSKDVATASQISVTGMTLGGTAAGNYSLSNTSYEVAEATIIPFDISSPTSMLVSPNSFTYDGNEHKPSTITLTFNDRTLVIGEGGMNVGG